MKLLSVDIPTKVNYGKGLSFFLIPAVLVRVAIARVTAINFLLLLKKKVANPPGRTVRYGRGKAHPSR